MKIAIIGGTGKMGRWFARFLRDNGKEIIISGRNEAKVKQAGQELGVQSAPLPEAVKSADAIMLSVPPDSFEDVVKQIAPHVRPEQIIIDITSIKTAPVDIMHKYLSRAIVLGTHPMFGPGAQNIADKNIILTPTNTAEEAFAQKVKVYLEERGAHVSLMSPREHDEVMSIVLGLPHFIALVAGDTLLGSGKLAQVKALGGTTLKVLLALAESVAAEDPDFYASLQMSLPGVSALEGLFQQRAQAWAGLVSGKDRDVFVRKMKELRVGLEQADPDFRKAYEKLNRIAEGL